MEVDNSIFNTIFRAYTGRYRSMVFSSPKMIEERWSLKVEVEDPTEHKLIIEITLTPDGTNS